MQTPSERIRELQDRELLIGIGKLTGSMKINKEGCAINAIFEFLKEYVKNPMMYVEKKEPRFECKCGCGGNNCAMRLCDDKCHLFNKPACPIPNCGKLSACCGRKVYIEMKKRTGNEICLGCLKPFTPAPCVGDKWEHEHCWEMDTRHIKGLEINHSDCEKCCIDKDCPPREMREIKGEPTENMVEEWEKQLERVIDRIEWSSGVYMPGQQKDELKGIYFEAVAKAKLEERKKIRTAIEYKDYFGSRDIKTILSIPELKD